MRGPGCIGPPREECPLANGVGRGRRAFGDAKGEEAPSPPRSGRRRHPIQREAPGQARGNHRSPPSPLPSPPLGERELIARIPQKPPCRWPSQNLRYSTITLRDDRRQDKVPHAQDPRPAKRHPPRPGRPGLPGLPRHPGSPRRPRVRAFPGPRPGRPFCPGLAGPGPGPRPRPPPSRPELWQDPVRRTALADFLARAFFRSLGPGREVSVYRPSQKVLARSTVVIDRGGYRAALFGQPPGPGQADHGPPGRRDPLPGGAGDRPGLAHLGPGRPGGGLCPGGDGGGPAGPAGGPGGAGVGGLCRRRGGPAPGRGRRGHPPCPLRPGRFPSAARIPWP